MDVASKPKVLFIMHMPPPMHGAAQIGQYIHDSVLINESFECRYINPSASANVSMIGRLSINKINFLITSLKKISNTIQEWQPDLVYLTPSSWDWGFYRDFLTVMLIKRNRCNIVAHYHNKGVEHFMNRWYNKQLYKWFFKDIKTIFLTTRLSGDFRPYLDDNQIFICPNGIDSLQLIDKNKRERDKKIPFNFMFLSNMLEEKGVLVLLEACKLLKEQRGNFICTFVGKWSDITEEFFSQKVREYHLEDNVIAVGGKYGQEKVEFFMNADCFVFPTYYHGECFPLVLLEAMSFGLPCISTNEGGIPDLLDDGKNGIIVEKKNPEKLSIAMKKMMMDPVMATMMGKNAYEKFKQNYTLHKFEENICSILNVCLK